MTVTAMTDVRMPRARGPRHQHGYLLPAVVVIVAASMIFVSATFERAQRQLRELGPLVAVTDAAVERASTLSQLLFALLTEPASALGIGMTPSLALRVDDSPYLAGERTLLQIRDVAGLIDINRADISTLRRLLAFAGVPSEARDTLADRILDYIDEDHFRRLNGAEDEDYRAAGLPPPRNRRLDSALQLRGVLGWDALVPSGAMSIIEAAITTAHQGTINPNAATAAGLVAALDVPPQVAEALVAQRDGGRLLSEADLAAVIPAPRIPLHYAIDPVASRRMRIVVADRETGLGTRVGVTITPYGQHWPWTVDSIESFHVADVFDLVRRGRQLPVPTPTPSAAQNETQQDRMF